MRFEWSIDGTVLDESYGFDNTSFGHFPNIYYNFIDGGIKEVKLSAWNIADPTKITTYTVSVNIQPVFGATKEVFPNIPNVFTPNGDNIHDFFEVPTSGMSLLKFMVYSRGGGLIYQQESNVIKWNGTNLNGKDLPEGIYYYIIEDLDGRYENAKGFFYIFRGK
jgi:gliding motility-associated-like protein